MERFPDLLAKAIYVRDQIGYSMEMTELGKLPKVREEGNPKLQPRVRPPHLGAVGISKFKKSHKAVAEGCDLIYVIEVKSAQWHTLTEAGKNGELFDRLLSIEVVEKADGSLRYGLFKAGAGYHAESIEKFGDWSADVVDLRTQPKKAPPTPEELAKEQAKANLANRPDAVAVTSDPED
jgi:hypothetical protein